MNDARQMGGRSGLRVNHRGVVSAKGHRQRGWQVYVERLQRPVQRVRVGQECGVRVGARRRWILCKTHTHTATNEFSVESSPQKEFLLYISREFLGRKVGPLKTGKDAAATPGEGRKLNGDLPVKKVFSLECRFLFLSLLSDQRKNEVRAVINAPG